MMVILVKESKKASWQPCICRTSGPKSVVRPGAVHHVMVNLVAAEEGFQAYKSINMQELLIKQARSHAQAWSLSGHACVLVGMWVESDGMLCTTKNAANGPVESVSYKFTCVDRQMPWFTSDPHHYMQGPCRRECA